MWVKNKLGAGFTIVELLIVVVVIGILAAITVVSYTGVQQSAKNTKMKSELATLAKVVVLARTSTSKTLGQITGNYFSAGDCLSKPTGTDLAALPVSDVCWVTYKSDLDLLSIASGVNVRNFVDAWGRPYAIDENDGEPGVCAQDSIRVLGQPFVMNSTYGGVDMVLVPTSGLVTCIL